MACHSNCCDTALMDKTASTMCARVYVYVCVCVFDIVSFFKKM